MRAADYERVSTLEQRKNGTSLVAQRDAIRNYCKLSGLKLVGSFVDGGVSGTIPLAQRPRGSKLMALIDKGLIDTVVVTKLDRGFRDAIDAMATIDALDAKGVSVIILDLGGSPVDSKTPAGRFMLTVLAAAAEMERRLINERLQGARERRRAQGYKVGSAIPFGYDLEAPDSKKLVENPAEQETVRLIRIMHGDGLSLRRIAAELNSRGLRTKCGADWKASQVSSVIKRAA